jgi:hypothetical protein
MVRENGRLDRLNTLEATSRASNKDMDNCIFLVVIFIREILWKTKDRVTDKCFGLMDLFIKEIGKVEFKMERVKFI